MAISNTPTPVTQIGKRQPYRRRDVPESHRSTFGRALSPYRDRRRVASRQDRSEFRRRYEPSHPDADAHGFVSLPNVDQPQEMVDMLSAARAYQANLTAIGLIRDLVARALELGR